MDEKILKWLYDISDENVWAIITKHLPILGAEVKELIDKTAS